MSDAKVESPLKELRFSEVTRFLMSRVPNHFCPCCNSNQWTAQYGRLQDDGDVIVSALAWPMSAPFIAQSKPGSEMVSFIPFARPMLPLLCGVCGYVRVFDFSFVRKWLAENPNTGQPSH